jgi:HD superfamily phosphodiesterase
MNCFNEAIEKAKKLTFEIIDPTHDIVHVKCVVDLSLKIAEKVPCADKEIIEVAAWWHDVARTLPGDHAEKSAELAKNFLIENGESKEFATKVYKAICNHSWHAEEPETIEGKIIRDADKVDFISVLRWQHIIEEKDDAYVGEFIKVFPKIRDELLYLEESKRIFDEMLPDFKAFVKVQTWDKLDGAKKVLGLE